MREQDEGRDRDQPEHQRETAVDRIDEVAGRLPADAHVFAGAVGGVLDALEGRLALIGAAVAIGIASTSAVPPRRQSLPARATAPCTPSTLSSAAGTVSHESPCRGSLDRTTYAARCRSPSSLAGLVWSQASGSQTAPHDGIRAAFPVSPRHVACHAFPSRDVFRRGPRYERRPAGHSPRRSSGTRSGGEP